MPGAIEYQKVMTEIVYVNMPGPDEPTERMSGSELLHGFLSDLHNAENPTIKQYVNELCIKWNVHYRKAQK